jgi:hypothetical protein
MAKRVQKMSEEEVLLSQDFKSDVEKRNDELEIKFNNALIKHKYLPFSISSYWQLRGKIALEDFGYFCIVHLKLTEEDAKQLKEIIKEKEIYYKRKFFK